MADPDFEPERRTIIAITNAPNASITTLTDHGYINNATVCVYVPDTYGMKFDYIETKISVTGLNTFDCDLDTQEMDPFVIPVLVSFTPAQVMPVTQTIENIAR
jgi:hypothetical protein